MSMAEPIRQISRLALLGHPVLNVTILLLFEMHGSKYNGKLKMAETVQRIAGFLSLKHFFQK